MDWQAEQAAERLAQKGQITAIVEDQASFHVAKKSREKFQEWEQKGLYIFLLPSYSKEIINRGGEKISPREIDEVLLDHHAIDQVVTFAAPHTLLGKDEATEDYEMGEL